MTIYPKPGKSYHSTIEIQYDWDWNLEFRDSDGRAITKDTLKRDAGTPVDVRCDNIDRTVRVAK